MKSHNFHLKDRQRGAVLIISLLMLMIMTILAISISQTGTLEQRMAGNARDADAAFQAAEAGLRAAESRLNAAADAGTLSFCDDLSQCTAAEPLYFATADLTQPSFWNGTGVEYGAAGTHELTAVKEDPRYITSLRAEVSDSATVGGGPGGSKVTQFYDVTAHGYGVTDTAEAITSAVIAIPKN